MWRTASSVVIALLLLVAVDQAATKPAKKPKEQPRAPEKRPESVDEAFELAKKKHEKHKQAPKKERLVGDAMQRKEAEVQPISKDGLAYAKDGLTEWREGLGECMRSKIELFTGADGKLRTRKMGEIQKWIVSLMVQEERDRYEAEKRRKNPKKPPTPKHKMSKSERIHKELMGELGGVFDDGLDKKEEKRQEEKKWKNIRATYENSAANIFNHMYQKAKFNDQTELTIREYCDLQYRTGMASPMDDETQTPKYAMEQQMKKREEEVAENSWWVEEDEDEEEDEDDESDESDDDEDEADDEDASDENEDL